LACPGPRAPARGHGALPLARLAFEFGAREPHAVGLRERPHVLWRRCCRSCFHRTSLLIPGPSWWEPVVCMSPAERARENGSRFRDAHLTARRPRRPLPMIFSALHVPVRPSPRDGPRRALTETQASPIPPRLSTLNHPPHSQRAQIFLPVLTF